MPLLPPSRPSARRPSPPPQDQRRRLSQLDSGAFRQWKVDSISMRDKLGIPLDYKPYTEASPKRGVTGVAHSPRVLELLDIAEADRLMHKAPLQDFWADVSQGVARRSWGTLRTMTTNSAFFDFERGSLAPPEAGLIFQGFPMAAVFGPRGADSGVAAGCSFSPRTLARFAGQGMSLPCLGSCMLAFFLNSRAPWWAADVE